MEFKTCTKCDESLPLDKFSKKKNGLNSRCKRCVSEYYRNYYHSSEERKAYLKSATKAYKDKNRNKHRAAKYGISEEALEELLSLHDGKCHICLKREGTCVDHCHDTKVVRGMLCPPCNRAIGVLGDNAESLYRVYKYLAAVSPLPDKE